MGKDSHQSVVSMRKSEPLNVRFVLLAAAALDLFLTCAACAAATQEEVFRSLHQNITETPQSGKLFAVLLGGIVVAAVLIYVSTRDKREAAPKALNHQGKLLKEVQKTVPLSATAVKSLKRLAEEKECISPLTLLLCPSLRQRPADKPPSSVNPPAPRKMSRTGEARI